jgi:hypothetical protein
MSEPTIDDRQQVIADLQAARGELVTRGWCKNQLQSRDGQVCAVGAVQMAIMGHVGLTPADVEFDRVVTAQRALGRLVEIGDVGSYNDADDTGYQDVLNLFDKALADLGGLA